MRQPWRLSLAAFAAAAFVACGGSGSGGGGPVAGGLPPTSQTPNAVALTIKIPQPSTSSSARRGLYISPGTQSIGVVVTPQGLTPSPPAFVNISSCPTVGGVITCTITVTASYGNDTFVITAYTGTNGTGSVLSTGSTVANVVNGGAVPTVNVTLGGVIGIITITPQTTTLGLGQATTLNVSVKDASGATFVGTYPATVTLSATGLTLSLTSIPDSTHASGITIAWPFGYASPAPVNITATAGSATGTVTITPGNGIVYYQTGTNPTTDTTGFKMIAGADGNLYYTSLGPFTCPANGPCHATSGAIHQFNPTTFVDTEVALQSMGVGLTFDSNGALWIAGGFPPNATTGLGYVYRMAPAQFSSAALTAIPVPSPTPTTGAAQPQNINIRGFAQDGSSLMWFVDRGGHRLMNVPLTGSTVSSYPVPTGQPSTTPGGKGAGSSVQYIGGNLLVDDNRNGVVDVINVTGATPAPTGQYLMNAQAALASPTLNWWSTYDSTSDGTLMYISGLGNALSALPNGDVEAFNPTTHTFTTLSMLSGPVYSEFGASSKNGTMFYVQDFGTASLHQYNTSANTDRAFPLSQAIFYNPTAFPNGIAALADGTAWFSCYGTGTLTTFVPLCVGHTVYPGPWTLWPGYSLSIAGAGMTSAQLVGIMEAPGTNSGPFTVSSGNTAVCTIANPSDHNFVVVGQGAGACSVSVTDAHAVTQTINVTVTTTSGTVQGRRGGVQ